MEKNTPKTKAPKSKYSIGCIYTPPGMTGGTPWVLATKRGVAISLHATKEEAEAALAKIEAETK